MRLSCEWGGVGQGGTGEGGSLAGPTVCGFLLGPSAGCCYS